MTASPADQDPILVDVSDLPLTDLLDNNETPLAESLRRLRGLVEHRAEAVAGFQNALPVPDSIGPGERP